MAAVACLAAGASAATVPRFLGCSAYYAKNPTGTVRPKMIVVACGDGNFWFAGLHWQTWTATGAAATGTAHLNDCTPNCAAGHFHTYPASVRLSAPKTCKGKHELTRISWRFTAAKPAGVDRTGTDTYRCA